MPEERRLNLLVVICHDLGKHLGCYGRRDVRSPHIDEFASEGLRFDRCFCAAPQCSPARAALWTGRYPHANGVVGLAHGKFANDLHAGERHFAEILADAGYETALFGTQHESPNWRRCGYRHRYPQAPALKLAEDFGTFVSEREGEAEPWFAQIGFFEPHRPFPSEGVERKPPEAVDPLPHLPDIPEVREDLADMEASVATADRAFGRILKALRESSFAENTLVLFTSDHGIPFPRAKMALYDPGIEVPLVLQGPGFPRGAICGEMVSHLDVLPTLLEVLGVPLPDNLHGRSFHPLLQGSDWKGNPAIFSEKTYHTYYDPMRSIRTERWKLIVNFENAPWQQTQPDIFRNSKSYYEVAKALDRPHSMMYHDAYELYDLEADPLEEKNLAEEVEFQSTRDLLIVQLREWMEATGDPLLEGPIPQGTYLRRMEAFKAVKRE